MPETGPQSSVRSLLAKFENNHSNPTSPPSRGRSPVGSDSPGSGRPLSKVRASFVAVERATQSSPVSWLRKESGRSESPVLKSVASEDAHVGLRSPLSFSSTNGFGVEKPADDSPSGAVKVDSERRVPTQKSGSDAPKADNASPAEIAATKETKPEPNRPTVAAPTEKPLSQSPAAKTVTERPSNAHLAKNNLATSNASKVPPASPKVSANPRTSGTSTKPAGEVATKPARQSAAATARSTSNEPAKTVTQKPSRTSLNQGSKTATRTSRETTKSTPSPAATKPARLPSSTTTPALSSTAKAGTRQPGASTATSKLNRKPSSLKVANNGSQRPTTPTTSSVRKQTSRASLPSQSSYERPGSRVSSTSSKPVDEGFLARMMRPTASSASKVHDKIEVKSPPRPSKSALDLRKVTPKADEHAVHAAKEKDSPAKIQKEKPQPEAKQQTRPKEQKDIQSAQNAKGGAIEPRGALPKVTEQPTLETTEKVLKKPKEQPSSKKLEETAVETVEVASTGSVELPVNPAVEASGNDPAEKPEEPVDVTVQSSNNEPTEATAPHELSTMQAEEAAPQPTDATEGSANSASAPEEQIPSISEPPVESTQPSTDTPRYATPDIKELIKTDRSAESSSLETSFVDTVETTSPAGSKPDEADVDAGAQAHEEPSAEAAAATS